MLDAPTQEWVPDWEGWPVPEERRFPLHDDILGLPPEPPPRAQALAPAALLGILAGALGAVGGAAMLVHEFLCSHV